MKEERWRWRRAEKVLEEQKHKSAKEQECPAEGGIVSRRFLCFRGSGLILPSVALLSH